MISWKFAVGIHFCPVDKWLLQREVFFYTSPVDSEDHTPDMPIDRQIRYASEVQYKWSERLSTSAQFVYAEYGKIKIDNDLLKGDRNEMIFSFSPKTQTENFENQRFSNTIYLGSFVYIP